MKANNLLILEPIGDGFDIGNVANSVAVFVPPVRCSVIAAVAFSNTAVANSFTVTIGLTNTASTAGSIVVPDSTSAYVMYQDTLSPALAVEAGVPLLVCVTEAGDSGEKGFVRLICESEADTPANDGSVIESA